jgi:hypothetical protein
MFVGHGVNAPSSTIDEARLSSGTGGTFGDERLREVWVETRDVMTRWARGETVTLPTQSITITFRRRPNTGKDLHGQRETTVEGRTTFIMAVVDLLCDPAVRVRQCDRCHEFFVPRRRQERHPACARAYHDQVWNAKRQQQKKNKEGDANG